GSSLYARREPIKLQDDLVLRACRRRRDDGRQRDAEKRNQEGAKAAQAPARVCLNQRLPQLTAAWHGIGSAADCNALPINDLTSNGRTRSAGSLPAAGG